MYLFNFSFLYYPIFSPGLFYIFYLLLIYIFLFSSLSLFDALNGGSSAIDGSWYL